ncbi:MAG: ceramidase domain-containing protein [Pseudobdellovibrio sp.]
MDMMNCPWPSNTQLPPHYCEENLCAWVVQPANTWSNIGYLIVALMILRHKHWHTDKYWFSFVSILLFVGSTLYHMTGTYWGRDLDVGAMLVLSGFVLSLTLSRYLNFPKKYLFFIVPAISIASMVNIHAGWGGRLFVIQVVVTAIAEWAYAHTIRVPAHLKKSLIQALLLFLFALALNLTDMNRIYCLPSNNVITLHAIWHLLCSYCIYLVVKYYCYTEKTI